jgi:hypothetical protein
MAPMAGRITNAEKYRFVFRFGLQQRFFTPRIPLDGVVRVLQKIRTGFLIRRLGTAAPGDP